LTSIDVDSYHPNKVLQLFNKPGAISKGFPAIAPSDPVKGNALFSNFIVTLANEKHKNTPTS
jgi:hypothetical protein